MNDCWLQGLFLKSKPTLIFISVCLMLAEHHTPCKHHKAWKGKLKAGVDHCGYLCTQHREAQSKYLKLLLLSHKVLASTGAIPSLREMKPKPLSYVFSTYWKGKIQMCSGPSAGGLIRKSSAFMLIKKEKYCKNILLACIQIKSAGIKVACGQW